MAKHRKVCGKNKPPKSRMVINRDSYARNKDKIPQKRHEKRMYDQFRRPQVARKQLADLVPQPVEVEDMERTAWTPFSKTHLLYGVSLDPELFAHFLTELTARCKARHKHSPIMVPVNDLYRAAIFVLHPDKLLGTNFRAIFGKRINKATECYTETARTFNDIMSGLKANTDMAPQVVIGAMDEVEFSNERRRVALAREAKAQSEHVYEKLKATFRVYRKKTGRYQRATDRHFAEFQARKKEAQDDK